MSALGHRTSQEQTYQITKMILEAGIPGDMVECGVYAGASCAIMARAIMDHSAHWGRKVHLFDTFAGIPAPGEHDGALSGNVGGESVCPVDGVVANMEAWGIPSELLVYHVGLFADTVPLAVEYSKRRTLEEIALFAAGRRFVRIDARPDGAFVPDCQPRRLCDRRRLRPRRRAQGR